MIGDTRLVIHSAIQLVFESRRYLEHCTDNLMYIPIAVVVFSNVILISSSL